MLAEARRGQLCWMSLPPSSKGMFRVSRFARIAPLLAALAALTSAAPASAIPSRNMTLLAHLDEYGTPPSGQQYAYSACWSYIHPDGREYAVIGTGTGTAVYNVTNPTATYRVGFIPGPVSVWREMKSYRTWIYIVTEGLGVGQGLQIVRMTDPEHPVLAATYATHFVRSHTVSVDTTRALLVCNGTRNAAGQLAGMYVLSLANPEAPLEIGRWPPDPPPVDAAHYVHDCVLVGDRLFAASIYAGIERVLTVADPTAPGEIAEWTYPGAYYTHSSWPDATGRWLYVTDEQNGQPLRVFDIANLAAPALVNGITSNPAAIVHNPRVVGSELYLANYTEGVRVLDITDPAHPAEFAWADSYPGISGGYGGVWEVCPYFPSGIIIASDMETGLYVYRPVRNYGLLRVHLVDADGGSTEGRRVNLVTQGDSLATPPDGILQFAPTPGVHTVSVNAFGYYEAKATAMVSLGAVTPVTLTLVPRPAGRFGGTVRDALTNAPIFGADVQIGPLHAQTSSGGDYGFTLVPADQYRIEVHAAGYAPTMIQRSIAPSDPGQDFRLRRAPIYDDFATETGWVAGAPGDDATSGQWVRVAPLGTGEPPGQLFHPAASAMRRPSIRPLHEAPAATAPGTPQPYFDHTPGADSMCFVTGQGTNSYDPDEADVDFGHTTLTSPPYDLSAMVRPTIGYWRWFYSWFAGTGQPDPDDGLTALLSNDNGITWVPVETARGRHDVWEEHTIAVGDYVTPSHQVRVRFVAADLGVPSTVEAAIDDFEAYDGYAGPADVPPGRAAPLHFRAPWPNPAAGRVTLVLETPAPGAGVVDVHDASGRIVRHLWIGTVPGVTLELRWDGADDQGRAVPSGLYFVRARVGGREAVVRLARTR